MGLDPSFPRENHLLGSQSFLMLNSDRALTADCCVLLSLETRYTWSLRSRSSVSMRSWSCVFTSSWAPLGFLSLRNSPIIHLHMESSRNDANSSIARNPRF